MIAHDKRAIIGPISNRNIRQSLHRSWPITHDPPRRPTTAVSSPKSFDRRRLSDSIDAILSPVKAAEYPAPAIRPANCSFARRISLAAKLWRSCSSATAWSCPPSSPTAFRMPTIPCASRFCDCCWMLSPSWPRSRQPRPVNPRSHPQVRTSRVPGPDAAPGRYLP
jgi:hypothetical protein